MTVPPTDTPAKAVFAAVVLVMFAVGTVAPLAMVQTWGRSVPRRLLLVVAWAGAALLVARGGAGVVDTVLRESGLAPDGLTGLTYEQVTGDAAPTAYTVWSGVGIDLDFLLGGVLFGRLARRFRDQPSGVADDDSRPTTDRASRTSVAPEGA